jgi:hypothetical protein
MSDSLAQPESGGTTLESRVVQMNYTGGIIGIFSNKRIKLESEIQRWNGDGYRLRHVLPSKSGIAQAIVQLLCLTVTLMIWCVEPGETLVFERGR